MLVLTIQIGVVLVLWALLIVVNYLYVKTAELDREEKRCSHSKPNESKKRGRTP
jgi:hypothetical protein